MPTLTVRNVETVTLNRLKRRVEAHRRSLEAEVREPHDRILTRRGGEPLPTDSVRVLATVRDEA